MTWKESECGIKRNTLLLPYLRKQKYESILSLGGGPGDHYTLFDCPLIVNIEIWRPYAKHCQRWKFASVVLADVLHLPIRDGYRWDLILLTDIVEHFEEKDVENMFKLIEMCTKIGKEVVITTPCSDTRGALSTDGDPFNQHRSYWNTKDFIDRIERLGFSTSSYLNGETEAVLWRYINEME